MSLKIAGPLLVRLFHGVDIAVPNKQRKYTGLHPIIYNYQHADNESKIKMRKMLWNTIKENRIEIKAKLELNTLILNPDLQWRLFHPGYLEERYFFSDKWRAIFDKRWNIDEAASTIQRCWRNHIWCHKILFNTNTKTGKFYANLVYHVNQYRDNKI